MRRHADAAGFTLIEMLVAITLMVVLLLPLMRSFSSGLQVRGRSDALTEATLIAESQLETIAANRAFNSEASSDRRQGRYHVRTSVQRYTVGSVDPGIAVQPYEIRVTVSWPEGAQTRSVALRLLRLGPSLPAEAEGP